jgi:hypothetical protein
MRSIAGCQSDSRVGKYAKTESRRPLSSKSGIGPHDDTGVVKPCRTLLSPTGSGFETGWRTMLETQYRFGMAWALQGSMRNLEVWGQDEALLIRWTRCLASGPAHARQSFRLSGRDIAGVIREKHLQIA